MILMIAVLALGVVTIDPQSERAAAGIVDDAVAVTVGTANYALAQTPYLIDTTGRTIAVAIELANSCMSGPCNDLAMELAQAAANSIAPLYEMALSLATWCLQGGCNEAANQVLNELTPQVVALVQLAVDLCMRECMPVAQSLADLALSTTYSTAQTVLGLVGDPNAVVNAVIALLPDTSNPVGLVTDLANVALNLAHSLLATVQNSVEPVAAIVSSTIDSALALVVATLPAIIELVNSAPGLISPALAQALSVAAQTVATAQETLTQLPPPADAVGIAQSAVATAIAYISDLPVSPLPDVTAVPDPTWNGRNGESEPSDSLPLPEPINPLEGPLVGGVDDSVPAFVDGMPTLPSLSTSPQKSEMSSIGGCGILVNASTSTSESAAGCTPTLKPYADKQRLIEYAYRYTNPDMSTAEYNHSFITYEPLDCTNFVSQALRSAGWKDKSGYYKDATAWWYRDYPMPAAPQASYTWGGAHNLYHFMRFGGRADPIFRWADIQPGDIIQLNIPGYGRDKNAINHSMIVTSRDSDGMPRLTYHSSDTVDKRLDVIRAEQEKLAQQHNEPAKFYGWRLR